MDATHIPSALPDPEYDAELYEDVAVKRLFAWVIDVLLITAIVGLLVMASLLVAVFFLPVVYFGVSFLYRCLTLSIGSATPGMRFMSIELRTRDGQKLDPATAILHTAGYALSVVTVPMQLISIVLMLTTSRKQGLTDHVLGTAAVNRPLT